MMMLWGIIPPSPRHIFAAEQRAPELKNLLKACLGFQNNDLVFVINADDVGMSTEGDSAVFDLYQRGLIQTFSLMVPAPYFSSAAKKALAQKIPVGLHLTLTNEWQEKNAWSPILSKTDVPSLYNPQGYMWKSVALLSKHAEITEVRKELNAQIDRALSMSLHVTHLDFHMLYWYERPDFYKLAFELAQKYQLAIINQKFWQTQVQQDRLTQKWLQADIYSPDVTWMFYDPEAREKDQTFSLRQYRRMFQKAMPALHHLAIHPALESESLKQKMADAAFRFDDYRAWSDGGLDSVIQKRQIKFTNYADLQAIIAGHKKCSMPLSKNKRTLLKEN